MSCKCNQCKNNVFDSKAYLKISNIEKEIEEKIKKCKKIKDVQQREIKIQVLVNQLRLANRCKNALY